MKDPASVAKNWATRLSGATQQIQQGIQAVQVSPTEKAAQNVAAQVAGVTAAANSGKTAAALRRVTLQAWQNAAITKGVPRIATGAQAAIPKFTDFMTQWLPYEDQLKQKLASMPRGSLDQNQARMLLAFQWNAAFRRQGQ